MVALKLIHVACLICILLIMIICSFDKWYASSGLSLNIQYQDKTHEQREVETEVDPLQSRMEDIRKKVDAQAQARASQRNEAKKPSKNNGINEQEEVGRLNQKRDRSEINDREEKLPKQIKDRLGMDDREEVNNRLKQMKSKPKGSKSTPKYTEQREMDGRNKKDQQPKQNKNIQKPNKKPTKYTEQNKMDGRQEVEQQLKQKQNKKKPNKKPSKYTDDDICKAFTQNGVYKDHSWNPVGCTMHNYTTDEFRQCMIKHSKDNNKINHILFLGDSVVRQMFQTLQYFLLGEINRQNKITNDVMFNEEKCFTIIDFRWKPEGFMIADFVNEWDTIYKTSPPDFTLTSFGGWHLFKAYLYGENVIDEAYVALYDDYVRNVTGELMKHTDTTHMVWGHSKNINESVVATRNRDSTNWISALSQYYTKYPKTTQTLGEFYLDVARNAVKNSGIETWDIFHNLGNVFLHDTKSQDGVHYGNDSLNILIQIFVNYFCNHVVDHEDGTCCKNTKTW